MAVQRLVSVDCQNCPHELAQVEVLIDLTGSVHGARALPTPSERTKQALGQAV